MGEIVTIKISELEDIIQKEISKVLSIVSEKYKLNLEKLNNSIFNDAKSTSNYVINLKNNYSSLISVIKEKKPRPIDPSNFCLARKPNLKQCTRNKKNDCDFCASHQYSQPYGRINQEIIEKDKDKCKDTDKSKDKGKDKSISSNDVEKKRKIKKTTIKMKPKMIGDSEYFIDNNNHLYLQEKEQNNIKYRHIGNWNEHNNTIMFKNLLGGRDT